MYFSLYMRTGAKIYDSDFVHLGYVDDFFSSKTDNIDFFIRYISFTLYRQEQSS